MKKIEVLKLGLAIIYFIFLCIIVVGISIGLLWLIVYLINYVFDLSLHFTFMQYVGIGCIVLMVKQLFGRVK